MSPLALSHYIPWLSGHSTVPSYTAGDAQARSNGRHRRVDPRCPSPATGWLARAVASDELTLTGYRQRQVGRGRLSLATPWDNPIIGLIGRTSAAAAAGGGGPRYIIYL
jgi:hypothetical protein